MVAWFLSSVHVSGDSELSIGLLGGAMGNFLERKEEVGEEGNRNQDI